MERKEYPYMISIDWLQVFCHALNPNWIKLTNKGCNYEIKKLEYNSRQFSQIYEIYDHKHEPFATISTVPFSTLLNKQATLIKLNNRVLYCANCVNRLIDFMKSYEFEYKNISRIDICHDSNKLASGLKHKTLIDGFLQNKYEKVGQSNYTLQGSDGKSHEYSYIRFGSRSTGVCVYAYDKTKELKEVKNKPYIINEWIRQGINIEVPVWRIEISIKADKTNLVSTTTGHYFRLSTSVLTMQEQIESVFKTYSAQYFRFVRNKGQKRKKDMKEMDLFHWNALPGLKVITVSGEKDSGRMQKIMINTLDAIQEDTESYTENEINAALILKQKYIELYGMARIYKTIRERKGYTNYKKNKNNSD